MYADACILMYVQAYVPYVHTSIDAAAAADAPCT